MKKWVKGTIDNYGCETNNKRFKRDTNYRDLRPKNNCGNCKHSIWNCDAQIPFPECHLAEDRYNACIVEEYSICDSYIKK